MSGNRHYPQLDIGQTRSKPEHDWLLAAEVANVIRQNYKKISLPPGPPDRAPDRPPSGSLFLFDRRVLPHFRNDGHKWSKREGGNKLKEAHQKLKVGGVYALECYYAHGKENNNFRRRSYWLLEKKLSHFVLVHYLEVKQNEEDIYDSQEDMDSSAASRFPSYYYPSASAITGTCNLDITQASEHEGAELVYQHQGCSGFPLFTEFHWPSVQNMDFDFIPPYPGPTSNNDYGESSAIPDPIDNEPFHQDFSGPPRERQELGSHSAGREEWQGNWTNFIPITRANGIGAGWPPNEGLCDSEVHFAESNNAGSTSVDFELPFPLSPGSVRFIEHYR